jgi:hypothetical protein
MKSFPRKIAAFAAVCLMSVAAFAADPSGTWTFAGGGRGGAAPAQNSLVLAMKDGKLTGTLTAPGRGGQPAAPVNISAAELKGDVVSFTVERNFNGNSIVTKYSGKLEGDTITGKAEGPGRDGAVTSRDWVATRAK